MFLKTLIYFVSVACLIVLTYWVYLYVTDVQKVVSVERGIISSHHRESTFVELENGTIIETPIYEGMQGSDVLVVVTSGIRTGEISYRISKPSKILIAGDAKSFDEDEKRK